MNKEEKLSYLNDIYDEAVKATYDSRREAMEMFEYLRGNQLPDDIVALLESRGQPIQWENIIQEIDTSIEGMKMMTKTELEIMNRHPEDAGRVKLLESLHRATLDSNEWWSQKARADKDLRLALPRYLFGSTRLMMLSIVSKTLPSYLFGSTRDQIADLATVILPSYLFGSTQDALVEAIESFLPSYLFGSTQALAETLGTLKLPSYLFGSTHSM